MCVCVCVRERERERRTQVNIYYYVGRGSIKGAENCLMKSFMNSFLDNINLLQPTGHVMHQQFNIQQLYALPTLYLCVLYLSENRQRLVPLTA